LGWIQPGPGQPARPKASILLFVLCQLEAVLAHPWGGPHGYHDLRAAGSSRGQASQPARWPKPAGPAAGPSQPAGQGQASQRANQSSWPATSEGATPPLALPTRSSGRRPSERKNPANQSSRFQTFGTAQRDSPEGQPRGTAQKENLNGQPRGAAQRDSPEGQPRGQSKGKTRGTAQRDSPEGQPGGNSPGRQPRGKTQRDSSEGQPRATAQRNSPGGQPRGKT
jgi:hypothetical protein